MAGFLTGTIDEKTTFESSDFRTIVPPFMAEDRQPKDGIKADPEWTKRVGIGGMQNFDAAMLTPVVVEKRLVFMTPEWKNAFRYAATVAD